jgi:peptide/nickel transport system substrate-binding protein
MEGGLMVRKRLLRVGAFFVALTLVLGAAACGGGDGDEGAANGEAKKGGIYRVSSTSFEFTSAFDPTGEYLGDAHGIMLNMLIRTLVGLPHKAGAPGNELVPDLATELPEPTNGGKTYTFKLKDGVKFGPPLDRDITSRDVAYAFERMASEPLGAQYGFYYEGVIEGFDITPGPPKPVSGIETPDDKTIVFNLTQATGDFLNRVALPATGPIPQEVAKCSTKAGDYGRFLISSGPYMIKGSDQLDITSCDAMKPISGFDPTRRLSLVRNPSYDQSTDDQRENLIDGLEYTINTNEQDIFDRIEAGNLDGHVGSSIPSDVLRHYVTSSDLKDRVKAFGGDRTWYITMNLTQPPFDDVHVRKAANLVMDKAGLQRAWGGPTRGDIATHIVPDDMFGGALADYDPYATPDQSGDVAAAKAEMKQSKYDSNKDGVCDASVCKNILHITRNVTPWTDMVPVEESSFGKIGITLQTRELEGHYPVIQTTKRNIPIASGAGWGKDYADPSTFMVLFDSASLLPEGNANYSLVGLKRNQIGPLGIKGSTANVPSVDADIDKCTALLDEERMTCWQNLDKKIMEQIVPWVPYLDAKNVGIIGPAVTKYVYDQSSGTVAYSRVAVDKSKQR